jgi:hypothetical protein
MRMLRIECLERSVTVERKDQTGTVCFIRITGGVRTTAGTTVSAGVTGVVPVMGGGLSWEGSTGQGVRTLGWQGDRDGADVTLGRIGSPDLFMDPKIYYLVSRGYVGPSSLLGLCTTASPYLSYTPQKQMK